MKVESLKFAPVKITLENQDEINALYELANVVHVDEKGITSAVLPRVDTGIMNEVIHTLFFKLTSYHKLKGDHPNV